MVGCSLTLTTEICQRQEVQQKVTVQQTQVIKQSVKTAQKLGLSQLLDCRILLKHKEYPNALKGLKGMIKSDEVLKSKGSVGILIGGLSEEVWSRTREEFHLDAHKDVDVAILDTNYSPARLEHGIDWWAPQTKKIDVFSDGGHMKGVQKTWHQNGNFVVLSYGMKLEEKLTPGLYIPSPEWVIQMRLTEALSRVDKRVDAVIDDAVISNFKSRMGEKVKTRVPKFIEKEFEGQILSKAYKKDLPELDYVGLAKFDLETLAAINKYVEKM